VPDDTKGYWGVKPAFTAKLKSIMGDVGKFFGYDKDDPRLKQEGKRDPFAVPRKLMASVHKSFKNMEKLRKDSALAERQFIGKNGLGGSDDEVPINEIRRMVSTLMRLLASGVPQAFIESRYDERKPFADDFRLNLNRHLTEINLDEQLQGGVWNSMFSVGILKTGLAESSKEKKFMIGGEIMDPGEAFTISVDLNNFVIDMQATAPHDVAFVGDRYRRTYSWILEKKKARDKIIAREMGAQEDSADGQDRPEPRTSGTDEEPDERLYREGWCWDIYLPKENVMYTFAEGDDIPLDMFEWDGPESQYGPYELIGYDWPSREVLPASPVLYLAPLHQFINALALKIENQANRQKNLTAFKRGKEEDAKVIKKAEDGDIVGLHDPEGVRPMAFPGSDPANHNILVWAMREFTKRAGGLDTLTGAEPMSETVGQDKLLNQSANALVDEMRRVVRKALGRVVRKHAWYIWTDPIRDYEAPKPVQGTGMSTTAEFSPEVREGDFLDYNISIVTHSLQERTPEEERSALVQDWNEVMMPNAESLAQTGMMPNSQGYVERVFKLRGHEIGELLTPMDPNAMGADKPGQVPWPKGFGGQNETVNTRVSRPGTTAGAQDIATVQANAAMVQQRPAAGGMG